MWVIQIWTVLTALIAVVLAAPYENTNDYKYEFGFGHKTGGHFKHEHNQEHYKVKEEGHAEGQGYAKVEGKGSWKEEAKLHYPVHHHVPEHKPEVHYEWKKPEVHHEDHHGWQHEEPAWKKHDGIIIGSGSDGGIGSYVNEYGAGFDGFGTGGQFGGGSSFSF